MCLFSEIFSAMLNFSFVFGKELRELSLGIAVLLVAIYVISGDVT